jgi:hypothetical protein
MTINTLKTPGQTFKNFLYWKKDDDDKSVGSWAVIRNATKYPVVIRRFIRFSTVVLNKSRRYRYIYTHGSPENQRTYSHTQVK